MKLTISFLLVTFSTQIASLKSFQNGYYYTREGTKISGLIEFHRATFSVFGSKKSNIRFKENEEAKLVKLTADDISSFVIGSDSFSIVYNIKINSASGEYARDFAKVIMTGRVNLFVHMSASSDGRSDFENDRYVLSKDGKTFLWHLEPQKSKKSISGFFF